MPMWTRVPTAWIWCAGSAFCRMVKPSDQDRVGLSEDEQRDEDKPASSRPAGEAIHEGAGDGHP
jgi:hypothetical protein